MKRSIFLQKNKSQNLITPSSKSWTLASDGGGCRCVGMEKMRRNHVGEKKRGTKNRFFIFVLFFFSFCVCVISKAQIRGVGGFLFFLFFLNCEIQNFYLICRGQNEESYIIWGFIELNYNFYYLFRLGNTERILNCAN